MKKNIVILILTTILISLLMLRPIKNSPLLISNEINSTWDTIQFKNIEKRKDWLQNERENIFNYNSKGKPVSIKNGINKERVRHYKSKKDELKFTLNIYPHEIKHYNVQIEEKYLDFVTQKMFSLLENDSYILGGSNGIWLRQKPFIYSQKNILLLIPTEYTDSYFQSLKEYGIDFFQTDLKLNEDTIFDENITFMQFNIDVI